MNSELYSLLLNPIQATPAMEADDITGETRAATEEALGDTDPNSDNVEENLEQTDNIFGGEDEGGGDEEPPADEEPPQGEDEGAPEDTEGDTGGEEGEEPAEDVPPEEPPEPPPAPFEDKNKLRDNAIHLYNIIVGDIDVISTILNRANDIQNVQLANIILNHLRNSKDYLFKLITRDLTILDYGELLRRYVTIKRVYDICIAMLSKHFREKENVELKQ